MNPDIPRARAAHPTDPPVAAEQVVADAMARLAGLDGLPTAAHVAAFEHLHVALTDALSAIDGV